METVTIPKPIAEFLFKAYFDFSDGNVTAAIKRAYRDLNRTLRGLPKEEVEREKLRVVWRGLLKSEIESTLLKNKFKDWNEFTLWHKSVCEKLVTINSDYSGLTMGHAQKWLNMTLKYLCVLGEERVNGVSVNYNFFHIPIDNIIQDQVLADLKGVSEFVKIKTWSTITSYDEYLNFQNRIKEVYSDRIPMDVEFELFNKGFSKPKLKD